MKSLIKASIRIILIFLFLSVITSLIIDIERIFAISNQPTNILVGEIIGFFLASFLFISVLFFAWRKTDFILKRVAGDLDEESLTITTSNTDLFNVIVRVFGIYLLLSSMPKLLGLLSVHIYNASFYSSIDVLSSQTAKANELGNS